jgi:hypothetical protein
MVMPFIEDIPSRQVLQETPARVLAFLSGVGTSLPIRGTLAQRGYTSEAHDELWRLLLGVTGYRNEQPSVDEAVRAAIAAVDAWDEPTFRLSRATLRTKHPEAYAFVFGDGLDAATGAAALVSVTKFLDRLDALEKGSERKGTRKADHAALARLAARGITPEERARVRKLVDTAKTATQAPPAPSGADPELERLIELRGAYEEWAEVARVVIRRRADLIRLGLAQRRRKDKGEDGDDTETPPPVAVAPTNGASGTPG